MAWLRRLGPVTRRNGTSVDRIGYRGIVLLRLAIVFWRRRCRPSREAPCRQRVLGTQRADFLAGTESSDRIVARGGNDRIAAEYDGGVDRVSCGAGRDVVVADARDRVESDCEIVSRRIHRDRHANPESQHESEVEPDSLTVGQTTVAVFQVGRNRTGGAASIGFSTSKDGGRTWREGTLPGLTANTTPRGPSVRASDPGRRVRRGARRLAGEHARDRRRRDAADDPPLAGRALVERPDRRGAVANGRTSPTTRTG